MDKDISPGMYELLVLDIKLSMILENLEDIRERINVLFEKMKEENDEKAQNGQES